MVDVDLLVLRLRAAGCVFAEEEALLLVDAATDDADLEAMVVRREAGFPLEPILGWAAFCGLRIAVEPGVFVPRVRTEFLVERALTLVSADSVVVDLCCGSGAIGAAMAAARPGIALYASDIEPAAVRCARRNLAGIGTVVAGDLFDPLPVSIRGRIDALLVNAPYVPSASIPLMPTEARLHEPLVTLDGGDDGLALHRRIAAEAPSWLAPGGCVLIETSEPQSERTRELFVAAGLRARIEHSDELNGSIVVASVGPFE